MLYVVLRSFEGGGIHLNPGDVIDEEVFGMPYGRAEQLASQRYLRLAPEGAKHTVVPDPTLVAGALRPDGDAGFDTDKFVKNALAEEDAAPVSEQPLPEIEVQVEQEQVAEPKPEPESGQADEPAPAPSPKRTTRKG